MQLSEKRLNYSHLLCSHSLARLLLFAGCILVYSSEESLEFLYDSVYKTFLAPSDERLQYQGLPVVILQALDSNLTEKGYLLLRDKGITLAHR